MFGEPNTLVHSSNGRLLVTMAALVTLAEDLKQHELIEARDEKRLLRRSVKVVASPRSNTLARTASTPTVA